MKGGGKVEGANVHLSARESSASLDSSNYM